jgi:hypothetical protein
VKVREKIIFHLSFSIFHLSLPRDGCSLIVITPSRTTGLTAHISITEQGKCKMRNENEKWKMSS